MALVHGHMVILYLSLSFYFLSSSSISLRDDSAVYLAGLGTVGMEIYEQVPKLDAVIVPTGGQCSLLVSTAAAIKHLNSRITVIVSVSSLSIFV